MNEIKLPPLPCPFCGAAANVTFVTDFRISSPRTGRRVSCSGCSVSTGAFATEDEAIAAWNRRGATAAIQADRAERGEPFGTVTVRRLSQRFEDHVDQYQFYPAGQSPYIDNVDEVHTLYATPPAHVEVLKQCVEAMELSLEDGAAYYMHVRDAIAAARQITGEKALCQ